MRDQIEKLEKHIEKIKDIALKNEDKLDFNSSQMTEDEIHKARELQKNINDITKFDFLKEYNKLKKIHFVYRMIYLGFFIVFIAILFYLGGKYTITKNNLEKITPQIKTLEQTKLELNKIKQKSEENEQKLKDLQTLLTQKDMQISNLKNSITGNILTNSEENKKDEQIINENTNDDKIENNPNEDIKKQCITQTTITINMRDTAGIDGKIITFLPEKTNVEVISKIEKSERTWYEIKTNSYTGFISSIGIENFNNNCLTQ